MSEYFNFYYKYALQSWHTMGPSGYSVVLISIGLFGWLLMMRGGNR